ncbi:2507_t:CDS:2 [Dentiscutata erythropus]|uniref:2507_t:CDS:1 n=1 Tax=Dentiscutata erythropus TaxID=1348616 RepID=A0A9N9FTJ4_9GLOM|nr:2507_t:CDS:2 [Dentiscutata erythropus]
MPNQRTIIKPPKSLEEEIVREKAKRILQNRYEFSEDQVNTLFSTQENEQCENVRAEAYALALSAKNANAGLSRLSCLRRELRNLGALPAIVEATKFPDITEEANKIQRDNQKKAEANCIDYLDHFTLESVKERLDSYDTSTLPDLQALADIMIMLCICPAELTTLRITDTGVTGYTKNRGQPDIPRKFRSMDKDRERARDLLTWIQNVIYSGRIDNPDNPGKPGVKWFNRFLKNYDLIPKYLRKMGAVYAVVMHRAQNLAHAMTIAGEALRHNPDNNTSPAQNYVIVNYRKKGQTPEQARPFHLYNDDN